jgi:hypothetical protein
MQGACEQQEGEQDLQNRLAAVDLLEQGRGRVTHRQAYQV